MSEREVLPFNFGPRTFTKKITFKNKKQSFHVSAIGPSLFIVPVGDVTPSTSSDEMRRSCIQVFRKGIGINIRGVSKFADSDHVVVYSSRAVAVIHDQEFSQVLKNKKGTEEMIILCQERIVELPADWKIIDLRCLDKSKLMMVWDTTLVIGVLKKIRRSNKFTMEWGNPNFSHQIKSLKPGMYGLPHPSLLPAVRRSLFLVDEGSFFLHGESGHAVVFNPKTASTVDLEPSEWTEDVNMLALFGTSKSRGIACITDKYVSSFRLSQKEHVVEKFDASYAFNKNFILGTPTGMVLVGKGSIFYYGRLQSPTSLIVKSSRKDVLCSGELSYAEAEEDENNKMIVCGENSEWELVHTFADLEGVLLQGFQTTEPYSLVFVSGNNIFRITSEGILEAYATKSNKLLLKKTFGRVVKSLFDRVVDVRVSSSRAPNIRLFLMTHQGTSIIVDLSMDANTATEFACRPAKWVMLLGKDLLFIAEDGGMCLADEQRNTRVMADVKYLFDGEPITADWKQDFVVRRVKSGIFYGLIIGYKNKLCHLMYKANENKGCIDDFNENDEKLLDHLKHTSILMAATKEIANHRSSKADSVHIADMILEVGGLLSLLLKNGTIVQYQLNLDANGVHFEFISSRRTDVIGLHLIRSPKGLRIVGLINNYEDKGPYRTCDDNMKDINGIVHKMEIDEMDASMALVDPYTSTVECKIPAWNPAYLKSAFLPDFDRGIMHTVVVQSVKGVGPGVLTYRLPISPPISLTKMRRPPGIFKGVASVKVDERYHVVVMSFLNVHAYILDSSTGNLEERAVFGWENDMSPPTLCEMKDGHILLMFHHKMLFTLIDLELTRGRGNYNIRLTPLTRRVLPNRISEQFPLNHCQSFISEVIPPTSLSTVSRREGMGHNTLLLNYIDRQSRDKWEAVIRVTPQFNRRTKDVNIVYKELFKGKVDGNREVIQVSTEVGIFVVERCVGGVVFRHGTYQMREELLSPINFISPLVYAHIVIDVCDFMPMDEKVVWTAVVFGKHRVCLYSMNIRKDGRVERHRKPTYLPFSKTTLPVKLFTRMEIVSDLLMAVYVYRLIKGTNHLEVIRANTYACHEQQDSIDYEELPQIFLEREGVEDLDSFDIHFINSDLLLINDGPRLLRVCKCSRVDVDQLMAHTLQCNSASGIY